MKRLWLWTALVTCALCSVLGVNARSELQQPAEPHRSPMDVAILPGGTRALTANHTSDSASLVDLDSGKVLAEIRCGHKPAGVGCSRDGCHAAISNLWSGTITLLSISGDTLQHDGTIDIGSMPRGLAFASDGGSLFVALSGDNEVVQIDWSSRKIVRRWPAPVEPRRLALSRDGRLLVAVSARSSQVRCWDAQTGKQLWMKTLAEAFNLHGLAISPDDREIVTAQVFDRQRAIAQNNISEGWALDNRLGRLTVDPDPRTDYWQIALDTRGKAVGDPCAAAFGTKGDYLAIAAAGTQELLLFRPQALPWSSGDPGDLLDSSLDVDESRFRRVPLGGRPLAVQFVEGTSHVVVANYLLDAVQVVDAGTGKLTKQIPLGGPSSLSLVRKGEAIFYDAKRSHHQWFSCHTCHPDGHTCSRSFDTLNDDSYGNAKLTPTLRGVSKTGPWTWHGWQENLSQAVEKSLTETLFGPKPTTNDVEAVVAFLGTLEHPPKMQLAESLQKAAARGKSLFHEKARCVRCHQGETYTSTKNFDLKMEPDGSPFEFWNPPSLRGVRDRGPYMHDGRAETLEDLLTTHHLPEKLGGKALTADERSDLIAFLLSL